MVRGGPGVSPVSGDTRGQGRGRGLSGYIIIQDHYNYKLLFWTIDKHLHLTNSPKRQRAAKYVSLEKGQSLGSEKCKIRRAFKLSICLIFMANFSISCICLSAKDKEKSVFVTFQVISRNMKLFVKLYPGSQTLVSKTQI